MTYLYARTQDSSNDKKTLSDGFHAGQIWQVVHGTRGGAAQGERAVGIEEGRKQRYRVR